MEITLEKIELVKDRTGVSYKEAKEALEEAEGSVVDAIINIEESIDIKNKSKIGESSAQIIESIKEAIRKGNVSKIIIKKDEEVVLNLPLNIGIIGTVLFPWAAIAGTITAFGTKCRIELIKDSGEIIDLSEMANETFETVVEKSVEIADEVKVKSADVINNVKEKASDAINRSKEEECEGTCGSEFECDDSCSQGSMDEEEPESEDSNVGEEESEKSTMDEIEL